MAMVIIGIGAIATLIGWIWLLIACFKESVLWGIGGLFCGLVTLIYGVMNFAELKVPVLLYGGGTVLLIIGQVMMGAK
jgi:hypothetical protein